MILVETHIITKNNKLFDEIDTLSFLSKNLFNSTLYTVRQHYFKYKKYLSYYDVNKLFIKNKQIDYINLPRKVSNHVLMQVDKSFKSFFKLLKTTNLNGKPKIPKYKNKLNGRNIIEYELGAIKQKQLRSGIIALSKTNIKIKFKNHGVGKLKLVRIVPLNVSYKIEICYEVIEKEQKINDKMISIDLGVNNLCAVTNNFNERYFIINGKHLKSINQLYNKKLAQMKNDLPKEIKSSKKIKEFIDKRNRKIKCELHKISKNLLNYCENHNVSNIIVGYNKNWKNECNLGKKTNQNFVQIPMLELINMLTYKARLNGITIILNEESYTSKCSFFDQESICKHDVYKGQRVKRGLFKTSDGTLINADINASLNIMKKVVPGFIEGNRGFAVNPLKVNTLAS